MSQTGSPEMSEGQEDDWKIEPPVVDNGEMFSIDELYPIPEFRRVLQIMINRHLGNPQYASLLTVLEYWEKRVVDVVASDPDIESDGFVGFATGQDEITRIWFGFAGEIAPNSPTQDQ
jgi:hypothetical protein